MAQARREATDVREEARAEGRKIVEDMRGPGQSRSGSTLLQQANEELTQQSRRARRPTCRSSVETLAASLASRVLGVDVTTRTRSRSRQGKGGSAVSTFIGQLIGFAVIVFLVWKYVVPPVRNMMQRQQEAVRTQLAEHAEAEEEGGRRRYRARQGAGRSQGRGGKGDRGGAT